jgi:putative N6-adenine-specific DNA methylase
MNNERMNNETFSLMAVTAFGLEAVVARELKALGYEPTKTEDGRVHFAGDWAAVCRANLWLRSADRVLILLGRFEAVDFGDFFDQVKELDWASWLAVDATFPVQARSVRSQLFSVRDCQRLAKKAIVEKLKLAHRVDWFDETGPEYPFEVSLLKDQVSVTLDTTGAGLNKRGYRKLTAKAPLRETLAAALIQLSVWNPDRVLVDPFCGSGTIPIEAVMIGRNMAPGRHREFKFQEWPQHDPAVWRQAIEEADDTVRDEDTAVIGYDIDSEVLSLARYHARRAGVENNIHFQQQDIAKLSSQRQYGCIITNPPYGERSGDRTEAERLYGLLRDTTAQLDTWSLFTITGHDQFERIMKRKPTRRRKLYNAKLACTYFQFLGPRPPRRTKPSAEGA